MANIVAPDSIFAKGYSSGGSDYDNDYYQPFVWGSQQNIGLSMIGVGVFLLILLGITSDNGND
jgi:hypothetical protein